MRNFLSLKHSRTQSCTTNFGCSIATKMSDPFYISRMIGLFCKECNRKVLDRCSHCGQFKPEFKPLPKDLCCGCGQLKTCEQKKESSKEESDEEEEDAIELKDGTLRRKCSCCNRPRNMCTKCKRPYITDSEDDSVEEENEEEGVTEEEDNEEEDEDEEEEQNGSGSNENNAPRAKRVKI